MSRLFFSTIDVTRQVFFRTSQTFALVNIQPIMPGHVLVCPTRVVPRLTDLTANEAAALFTSVQRVGTVVERAYGAHGLTIACQDGKAAGQSIPHVHVHILPRKLPASVTGVEPTGDPYAEDNDAIYPAIEAAEEALPKDLRGGDLDGLRVDAPRAPRRSMEEMVKEAEWLKGLFEREESEENQTSV